MHLRRLIAMTLLAAGASLLLAGCGDGDAAAPTTTSTERAGTSTQPTGSTAITTTSVSPRDHSKQFAAAIAKANAAIDAAGGDLCKLTSSMNSMGEIGDPANAEEAKTAVELIARYLNALAAVAPGGDGPIFTAAATTAVADAQAHGFDPKYLADNGLSGANDASFQQAMSRLQEHSVATCTATTTTAG